MNTYNKFNKSFRFISLVINNKRILIKDIESNKLEDLSNDKSISRQYRNYINLEILYII